MTKNFDFNLEPGKELKRINYDFDKPVISIIVPFYNDEKYIEQSVNSLLNQTFPCFELLIIDDGSKDEKSLAKLEMVSKVDERIKVFHKKNEGLAATRDYGASVASLDTKYFMFIDSDDLIDKTYLECAYWTLETNKDAAWAYSDSVGFECLEYTWNKWFDSDKLKKVNDLLSAALIRKEAYFEVGGYELREKAVNEDWNFWLKMIAKGRYPVHMSFYGQWYRRKENGELSKSKINKKRALEIINETASTITGSVTAIQYPLYNYDYDMFNEEFEFVPKIKIKDNKKTNILMIIPWMVVGGADIFNLELVKRLSEKDYNFIIVSTLPSTNPLRQEFEKYATVYDLTSFLDLKNWVCFINYLIKKENVDLIFNTNSLTGYTFLPYLKSKYPNIPIVDYVHMEEWYYQNGGYARMSYAYNDVIDKTLVCNKGTERVLINHFNLRKEDVETVYIGVDENKFDPTKFNESDILKKYNIDKKDRYIVSYICRISSQKRPMLLVEIIKKVISKRDDVLFLIVGDGDMLPLVKKALSDKDFSNSVLFLGNIKNTSEIYKISDLTLNCSIKEGLALTSYESLSMGIPVISSDVGGQKELIGDDVGIIVPCLQNETEINCFQYLNEEVDSYVDAIDKIISKIDEYKSKCRNKILNNFTLNKMSENMIKKFNEILDKEVKKTNKNTNLYFEIITQGFINNKETYNYLIGCYQKDIYGRKCTDESGNVVYNSKNELLREKLWKSSVWRKFVNTPLWKYAKKIIKR